MTARKRIRSLARSSEGSDVAAALLPAIRAIWETARGEDARSVNSDLVGANWRIGKHIVEAEQGGFFRAEYDRQILKSISASLSKEFGSGFSVSALQYMRAFFRGYPDLLSIRHAPRVESGREVDSQKQHSVRVVSGPGPEAPWSPGSLHPALSWTHYRALLKVDRRDARDFYEIEAVRQGWSARQIERQIDSLLFFRLQKSRDKKCLLALAARGHQIAAPIDAVKDPYVLEFLDLPVSHRLQETKLEEALLTRRSSRPNCVAKCPSSLRRPPHPLPGAPRRADPRPLRRRRRSDEQSRHREGTIERRAAGAGTVMSEGLP